MTAFQSDDGNPFRQPWSRPRVQPNEKETIDSNDNTASPPKFGPGLVGEIASFIYNAAPYSSEKVALAGAFCLMAGLCGRAYVFNGAGLNLYILNLAATGRGKEAAADGISKLMAAVGVTQKNAHTFRGPGEIRSDAALFRWIARLGDNPTMFSILGEIGVLLKQAASAKANPHTAAIVRTLLQLFGKSEIGSEFDPAAYADVEKITKRVSRPAITILGDSTPETFYGTIDEAMVNMGLVPRFTIFETTGERPRLNKERTLIPAADLIEKLSSMIAKILAHTTAETVAEVSANAEAWDLFEQFEEDVHRRYNTAQSEVERHLWSRVALNAKKLAALIAIGCDFEHPVIDAPAVRYAHDHMFRQTINLIAKFDHGETGDAAGNEILQQRSVMKVACDFVSNRDKYRHTSYNMSDSMIDSYIFTYAFISKRLLNTAAFNKEQDRSRALNKAIKNLVDYGDLIELTPRDMSNRFDGFRGRAFMVNPEQIGACR